MKLQLLTQGGEACVESENENEEIIEKKFSKANFKSMLSSINFEEYEVMNSKSSSFQMKGLMAYKLHVSY